MSHLRVIAFLLSGLCSLLCLHAQESSASDRRDSYPSTYGYLGLGLSGPFTVDYLVREERVFDAMATLGLGVQWTPTVGAGLSATAIRDLNFWEVFRSAHGIGLHLSWTPQQWLLLAEAGLTFRLRHEYNDANTTYYGFRPERQDGRGLPYGRLGLGYRLNHWLYVHGSVLGLWPVRGLQVYQGGQFLDPGVITSDQPIFRESDRLRFLSAQLGIGLWLRRR